MSRASAGGPVGSGRLRRDRGAAYERTDLAWQRTSLSVAAAAAVLARLSLDDLGWVGAVTLCAAAVLSVWIFAHSGSVEHPCGGVKAGKPGRPDGRPAALLAGAVVAVVVIELGVLLV